MCYSPIMGHLWSWCNYQNSSQFINHYHWVCFFLTQKRPILVIVQGHHDHPTVKPLPSQCNSEGVLLQLKGVGGLGGVCGAYENLQCCICVWLPLKASIYICRSFRAPGISHEEGLAKINTGSCPEQTSPLPPFNFHMGRLSETPSDKKIH